MPDIAPGRANADRNLLFGILALQMDFIGRDALVAAMNAWVLQKSTPLDQVLLNQGALRADTHALLDALVRKHLEMHGGDVQQSLAAVSSLGSARRVLEQIADPDLHASLAHVSAARAVEDDPFATCPPSAGVPTSVGQRFRILRPHARGGLGEVFVAQDTELHREVALKEIQDRHADDKNSRMRFLLEAEITGGLEHPGIVPVYGLGQYADGRPFYAMRFIRGDSLQDAIARFHRADTPGRDAGEQALTLRQLLGRFLDVCNAIAYAHSRGVLHRDLKPGNVMLGKYGETLVVDWGLAKPLGRPEGATESMEGPLQPSASGSTPTQMGSALGTPAYMPPEQAAGRLDQLGPPSDVYSLGATLYCLLTGVPPFEGADLGAVLRQVQRGEFRPPRQVKLTVPPALEAVCLKAMALKPADRYASPRALAEDIEHWLADEPVGAWPEPVATEARRWLSRITAEVAGSQEAIDLYKATLAVVERRTWAVPDVRDQVNLAQGYHNLGLLYRNAGEMEQAEFAYRKALEVRRELVRNYPSIVEYRFALANSHHNVGNLYRGMDRSPEAVLAYGEALTIREQLAREYPDFAVYQANLAASHYSLATLYSTSGEPYQAEVPYHNALQVQEILASQHPTRLEYHQEVGKTYHNLALLYRTIGQRNEAERFGRKALMAFQQLVQARPTAIDFQLSLGMSLVNLGQILSDRGDLPAAQEYYDRALQALTPVLGQDANNRTAQQCWRSLQKGRASVLTRQGEHQEALRAWDDALVGEDEPERNNTRLRRAVTLARLGDYVQAISEAESLLATMHRGGLIAVRIFSLASVAVRRDISLVLTAREQLAEHYAVRGVQLLASSLVADHRPGAPAINVLLEENDLDPLRSRADFQRLLESQGYKRNGKEAISSGSGGPEDH